MTASRIIMMTLAVLGLAHVEPASADPVGTWLTEGGRSRVRVGPCGGALCGTVVWLKEPDDPDTGKPKADKKNADASKRGRPLLGAAILLNAEDGKTYDGTLTEVSATSLKLEGCALAGFICKSQIWTRAN